MSLFPETSTIGTIADPTERLLAFVAEREASRAGLNRVLGRPADAGWTEPKWREELELLARDIAPDLKKFGVGRLHNQDLQSALCEFARYEKLRLGEGTARRYP